MEVYWQEIIVQGFSLPRRDADIDLVPGPRDPNKFDDDYQFLEGGYWEVSTASVAAIPLTPLPPSFNVEYRPTEIFARFTGTHPPGEAFTVLTRTFFLGCGTFERTENYYPE